jgi:hypothetical protein
MGREIEEAGERESSLPRSSAAKAVHKTEVN